MREQARQPIGLVVGQPAVHRIGLPPFQESLAGDRIRGGALVNLQQRGAPLPHIRTRVMVPVGLQLLLLLPTQRYHPPRSHLTYLLLGLRAWLYFITTRFACQTSLGVAVNLTVAAYRTVSSTILANLYTLVTLGASVLAGSITIILTGRLVALLSPIASLKLPRAKQSGPTLTLIVGLVALIPFIMSYFDEAVPTDVGGACLISAYAIAVVTALWGRKMGMGLSTIRLCPLSLAGAATRLFYPAPGCSGVRAIRGSQWHEAAV